MLGIALNWVFTHQLPFFDPTLQVVIGFVLAIGVAFMAILVFCVVITSDVRGALAIPAGIISAALLYMLGCWAFVLAGLSWIGWEIYKHWHRRNWVTY